MIHEHDRIVLLNDLTSEGLKRGDVGTVIHVHGENEAYEVEFLTLGGETVSIATLTAAQVRPIDRHEIAHARLMTA